MVRRHEEREREAEGLEQQRPSRPRTDGVRASTPPRVEEDVTSRVIPRQRAGRPDARVPAVEREPMARVVDAAAWRAERPQSNGDRESKVPPPHERE